MHSANWLLVGKFAVVLVLIALVFRQCRRPSGWLGKRIARGFNISHSKMTDWGLAQVAVATNAVILDVGCGGGRTIQKLAGMASQGKVTGLDYSPTCVAVARETNSQEIEAGRVQIEQGSVATLPFPDCHFDLVTAIETHYYWPDLTTNVREILRVVKPGGSFLLIAEAYRGGPLRLLYSLVMPLLRAKLLSDEEHRELLMQAGFVDVATHHIKGKNWIAATGRRPP
jgi:ubiquinone/menaquinone biosynthesis C-methylase UbiE